MKAFIDDHRDVYGVEPILGSSLRTCLPRVADRPVDLSCACRPPGRPVPIAGAHAAGCGPGDRGTPRVQRELRRLRRAQGVAADDARELRCRPLHDLASDAGDGAQRRRPRQARAHHHPRRLGAVSARPGEPRLQGAAPEHAVGVRLYLRRDLGRLCLRRLRHRRLRPAHSSGQARGQALAGACHASRERTSSSMRWSRPFISDGPSPAAGSCAIRTEEASMSAFAAPSASLRPASSHRSAASETATTMPSPRR